MSEQEAHGALSSPAPGSCPNCADETDCSNVRQCRAVEEAYAAPADAERLALAERIEKHAKAMARASIGPSLQHLSVIANDMLTASAALRAGGWREDMAAFGMRAYALCEPDGKHWRVVVGFQSLSDAQSALTAVANFPSAPKNTDKEG